MPEAYRPEKRTVEPDNTFALSGFFDHVNLIEKSVGPLTFKVPDVSDMHVLDKSVRGERLAAGDEKHKSNHHESTKNAADWVNRGIQELENAERFFTEGNEPAAHDQIREARRSFGMAQDISKTMARRYFPEYETPAN